MNIHTVGASALEKRPDLSWDNQFLFHNRAADSKSAFARQNDHYFRLFTAAQEFGC